MHTAAYGSCARTRSKKKQLRRSRRVDADQFRTARRFSGLSREDAAELVGVSLRTIGHWETGRARPSFAAFKLLRVYRHGDLIDPKWAGYSIIRGKLVTPENHTFEPHDLSWLSLLVRRARAFGDLLRERDAGAAYGAGATDAARADHAHRQQPFQARTGHQVAAAAVSVALSSGTAPALVGNTPLHAGVVLGNTPLPGGVVFHPDRASLHAAVVVDRSASGVDKPPCVTVSTVYPPLLVGDDYPFPASHCTHSWNGAPSSNTGLNRSGGAA